MARSIAVLQIDSVFAITLRSVGPAHCIEARRVPGLVLTSAEDAKQNLMLQRTQVKTLPTLQSGERTNPAGKPVSNNLSSCPSQMKSTTQFVLAWSISSPSHLTLHEPSEELECCASRKPRARLKSIT